MSGEPFVDQEARRAGPDGAVLCWREDGAWRFARESRRRPRTLPDPPPPDLPTFALEARP